jgi:phage recombination protein Bet
MSDKQRLPIPAAEAVLDGLLAVRDTLAPDLTLSELRLFALVATRSGLDPFARQIYAVKRKGRMTIQTGIDGYRSIAARTGEYDGQDEPIFGPDCTCGKGPKHPEFATVRVYRKGMSRPIAATAYWHEYVPEPGPSGQGDAMWRRMPHVMLSKVAEALALRKAFPWDPTRGVGIGSDVYTDEEMAQAGPAAPTAEEITIAEFARAVQGVPVDLVRKVRDEMFPGRGSVGELTGEERLALLRRIEAIKEQEAAEEPEPVEEEEIEEQVVEAEIVEQEAAPAVATVSVKCDAVSPLDFEPCDRERGHSGKHRSADLRQAW